MAIKTLRVFQEFTSEGYVPMPPAGNIDYGYTIAGTFPEETPTTFQLDDPDLDVEVTEMTDFYVWIRSHGSEWNINYTRNVRVYPDSPLINNVVMGIIIANLDYTVPYVGATENVDLGEFGISGGFVHLDNTPTTLNVPTTPGTLVWNDTDGTADLILKGGNVTLQIGQEQVVRVVNKTGATLNEADFSVVRIRSVSEGGAQGQRLAVMLAQADSDAHSATTIGVVTESILNNQEGFITTSGNINKIDTTGSKSYGGTETWVDGDVLYLSPTHAGYLTNVKPQAPNHTIIVGWVVYAHANNGKIFVKIDNGYELDELHNVKINNPLLDDFLMYDTTLNVWKNKDMHGTKGYIPYFNDTTLFLNSPFWTDGGLIGINTITPRSLMDLKGTTAYAKLIVDNNGATGGGMFSAYQNGVETAMFGTDAHYQTNTSLDAAVIAKQVGGGIQFYTNGSNSEKMGINSDGNVFIGQTPTWTTSATNFIVRGKTGAGHIGVMHYDMSIKGFMNTFNSVFQIGTSSFHSLAFLVGNTERGRVNSLGRLLWGTTTDNGTDLVQINGSLVATSIKKQGGLSTEFLMADGSVSTGATSGGTVTSVSATVPTGFAISGSPITTSGTLAISFASGYSLPTDAKQTQWDTAYTNRITSASLPLSISANTITIAQATNAANGYLSSTDWVTFNSKQSALSGTGYVKIIGTTISYDNTVYTPASRLITINGTSYDLSADRSWTITPGSGMRNVQSFIATSGQTTFTVTGGYTVGLVDVYVNGARLTPTDYTATSGTNVVLAVGVVTNDVVDIVSYTASLTSGITGSGTTGYIPKFTSSNVLGDSLIYSNATNVGIGTTTPSAVLHVIGTILSSSSVTATSFVKSGGTSAQILAADGSVITAGTNITISGGVISSSGGGSSGSGTTNYISKWTSSSALGNASLYDNGNIGLGTTNPDFVSSGDKVFTINGTSTRSTINLVNSSTGTTGVGGSLRGYNGSTFLVGLDLIADGATNSGAYVFYGANAGTVSEKFRITSKGGILPSGKIVVQNGVDGGASKGINLWLENDNNWGFYMAQAGAGKSLAGSTACGALDGSTSWGVRSRAYNGSTFNFIWENHTESALMSLNAGDGRLWVSESIRTKMIHLNANGENRGHRIYSRTMDVNSYTTATNMRFTIASGYNVQFQYEVTFHATRTTSGNPAEIWYLKYTAGIAYDTSRNPNERWWDLREQAGNGIAGVGRNNQVGYFEVQNSAYDSGCRLTCVVAITCNNWDAVTVTFP